MPQRSLRTIVTAHRQLEGGGFPVRRPIPTDGLRSVDPFLLLDEMGPVDWDPGQAIGAPDHPHRGFETVTYLLAGEMAHEDSTGRRGVLRPGDVQWMTAGDGVVHSELPTEAFQRTGGTMHGFQLWVNLPAASKRVPPRYQEIPGEDIPVARTPDGKVTVRVIAGESLGVDAAIETRTPIRYLHATLRPGGRLEQAVPAEHTGFAYCFAGEVLVGDPPKRLRSGQLGELGPGDSVVLAVDADADAPAEVLLLSGVPLDEPVVQYGPFVMNSEAEIYEAIRDYHAGRLGRIEREGDR